MAMVSKIGKKTLSFLLLFSFFTQAASAIEYNRPDPPGTLVFDRIPLRAVPVPNVKIPDSCEAQYRAGMENSFRKVWEQCRQAGQLEPSDCQRSLFERCTQLAAEIQKMEAATCIKMLGETDAIQGFQAVDNQKNSQSSTADLNQRAYAATKQVIAGLEASSREIDSHRKLALSTLSAPVCAASTAGAAYKTLEGKVGAQLNGVQSHLKSMIEVKKTSAAQFAKNSGMSHGNLDKLVSAAPAKSTITAAAPSAVYTGTVVQTVTGPSRTQTTVVTTTTSTPVSVMTIGTTSAPAAVAPLYIPPETPPQKKTNWIPILAIGIPAAILTAIVISKLSKNKAGGSDSSTGGDPGSSPSSASGAGDTPTEGGLPPSGNRNPPPSVVPGGGNIEAWKIVVDPSFTDKEKATIAAALDKIPACYRYKLQGLYIKNTVLKNDNPNAPAGSCVAGMFMFGGNTVFLSPKCTTAIGVGVHEFFHVIGNRNNNQVHEQWRPYANASPNCSVTAYGATNFYEDFAEAGRLLEFPESGGKFNRACVDEKIAGLGKIMNSCPTPSP